MLLCKQQAVTLCVLWQSRRRHVDEMYEHSTLICCLNTVGLDTQMKRQDEPVRQREEIRNLAEDTHTEAQYLIKPIC